MEIIMQTQIYVLNLIPTNSHVLIDRFSHTGMIAIIFNDTMIEKHGNNIHDMKLYQPSICTAGSSTDLSEEYTGQS